MRLRTTLSALVALAMVSTPALANHSWGGYHWARTAGQFTVNLAATPVSDPAWAGILSGPTACTTSGQSLNVANNWGLTGVPTVFSSADTTICPTWADLTLETAGVLGSVSVGGNMLRTRVTASSASAKRCPATSGIVVVCDAAYGNNGWLGLAQVWVSGGHITAGTAKMNDSYMGTGKSYGFPVWRRSVMCQEVGHTFGLGHQSENGDDFDTCMDYSRSPNLYPDQHDYNQLAGIYTHGDSTTTLAISTATAKALPLPSGAGLRRAGSGDNVWVEDLPNGLRRVVHVRWVDETVEHGPPHDA